MRVIVIDGNTGEIHAIEPSSVVSDTMPLILDSELGPLALPEDCPADMAFAWQPLRFSDGREIEVNRESGEIVGR